MNVIISVSIFCLAMYGWVANIVTLATDASLTTGMMIARAAGILFVPVGIVLGYL